MYVVAADLHRRRPYWRASRKAVGLAVGVPQPKAISPPRPVVARNGPVVVDTTPPEPQQESLQAPEPVPPVSRFPFPVSRKVWRALRWPLGIAALLVVGYVAWLGYAFVKLQADIYTPLPATPTPDAVAQTATANAEKELGDALRPTPDPLDSLPEGRINILVLGTDKRENDTDHWPRSDTMLLANLDTVERSVRIMTIPRDLVMNIPGYGRNKINAAYLFGEYYSEPGGGQALAVRTISEFFDVPVDYYVTVNFEGFRELVDAVGGVTIDVPYTIDDYNYPSDDEGYPFGMLHVRFEEGRQHMDGKTALRYARTRHADNDFMRSRRQLQIIMAMREKAMSLDLLPVLPSLLDRLGGMVETNIPLDQQVALVQMGYEIEPSNIMTMSIDSTLVTPVILDDGSEGLRLDWAKAEPLLDEFFGRTVADADALATPTTRPTFRTNGLTTPSAATPGVPSGPTRTPSRSPTPVPRRSPTPGR